MHMLPQTVISRYSNTYAKKPKRLGIGELPLGRLKMVISTYSNILLSASMINITKVRVSCGHERPLDCLKYLHETAKAPWNSEAVRVAHENKHTECVQYLLDNDCPLPDGWRYERWRRFTRLGIIDEVAFSDNARMRARKEKQLPSRSREIRGAERQIHRDMVPETAQN